VRSCCRGTTRCFCPRMAAGCRRRSAWSGLYHASAMARADDPHLPRGRRLDHPAHRRPRSMARSTPT
jgi:hypothetical protein